MHNFFLYSKPPEIELWEYLKIFRFGITQSPQCGFKERSSKTLVPRFGGLGREKNGQRKKSGSTTHHNFPRTTILDQIWGLKFDAQTGMDSNRTIFTFLGNFFRFFDFVMTSPASQTSLKNFDSIFRFPSYLATFGENLSSIAQILRSPELRL